MIDRKIIAACARSRSAFESVNGSIDPSEAIGDLIRPLWDELVAYYGRDPEAQVADTGLITDKFSSRSAGPKRQKAARELAEEIWALDVSPANVVDYVRDQALEAAAMRFAQATAARKPKEELEPLARAYVGLLDAPVPGSEEEEALSFSSALRKRVDVSSRIKVTPACLNERLGGGVFAGTNITIFGRPNRGKTALALTVACGFSRRGLRGLWLTNEDPALTGLVRASCNLTGLTEQEMQEDIDAAERLAISKGITRLVFRDISPGTPAEIERIIKSVKPQFVVIDQMRNLSMKGTDGNTNRLDAAAQFVRAMGKRYNAVTIGMAQADAASANKLVLEQEDIDSSKTGIPGAADVIIGVSSNEALDSAGQRMLSICKNKITNRHESWQVSFDPFRSRYTALK